MFNWIKSLFATTQTTIKEEATTIQGAQQATVYVPPTDCQLKEALLVLGNSSSEVAASLASLGIKGKKGMSSLCPITKFLESKGWKPNFVGCLSINCSCAGEAFFYAYQVPAVSQFVRDFDNGKYPELEG